MAEKTAKRKTGRKRAAKAGGQRRTTLKSGRKNTAYAKRRKSGTFKEIDGVGRSLSTDRRKKAKTKVKKGYGDRGDR